MVNVVISTAGTSGPRGNSLLSGVGAPSNSLGFDGDWYLNTLNVNEIFGPKAAGVWPAPVPFGSTVTNNFTATTDPSVNDDSSQGYSVGSAWVNTVTNVYFISSNVDVASAIWTPVLPVGTTAGTVAAGDDSRITGAIQTGATAGGDLGGTLPNPQVVATHLSAPLPLGQGGTGSTTQNFVDLTTNQNVGGAKTFTDRLLVSNPPVGADDVVNLGFVQGLSAGIVIHQEVAAATLTALPANTYFNGASGVGATLTANAPGVLVIDDYTVLLGDRLWVKNEVAPANNGIYTVTTLGTVSVPYVLTRATDMDEPSEIPGAGALVDNGTVNKGSGFTVFGTGPWTIGTTAINITQFSSPGFVNVGIGLRQVGNTISLETPVDPSNLPEATSATYGVVQLNTDLSGTATNPQVVATHLTAPLPLTQGGLDASTAAGGRTTLGLGTSSTEDVSTSAADFQPLGIQSPGSTGRVADAGHVHPTDGVVLMTDAAGTVVSETSYGQSTVVGVSTNYARQDHSHGSPALTSTPPATTEGIGQAAAVGTATDPARADHVHPLAAAGTPTTSAVGDSPSTGNATTFAASNHVHGREAFGSVTPLSAFGTSASNGTATTVSHSDHSHGAPALPSATTGAQGVVQLAGDLGGTAASPSVLKVNGTSVPTTPTTGQVLTATSGTSATWQSPTAAGPAGGDLSGTYPNPTVVKVNGTPVTGTPTFGQAIRATSPTAASWGFLPNFISTGLSTGGVMTQNGSLANAFDITAAVGYIADYTTSPTAPTVVQVNIAGQTVTLSGAQTTRVVNYWYADSTGTIQAQATPLTSVQKRQNINLGITWSVTGTGNLYEIMSNGIIQNQPGPSRAGIMQALGVFSTSGTGGNVITPNGANLSINKSAGNLFGPAIGYFATGANNPDQIASPAETVATVRYVTQLGNSESATRTTIDVGNYDVGGVVTAVPGGGANSTIQRVFVLPSGVAGAQLIVQYGTVVYSSLANAVAAIGLEAFTPCPDLSNHAAFLCYMAVEKGATQLNNAGQATFRTASRFANP